MQTFTAILALATLATASPVAVFPRSSCGTSPAGTGSHSPISQPTNCQTAQACQTSCTANTQCKSFVFGMVDSTIKCLLFAVPAAQVPSQGSSNLVAFDKACSDVPAVKPTTSNPTGKATTTTSNSNTGSQKGTDDKTNTGKTDTSKTSTDKTNTDNTKASSEKSTTNKINAREQKSTKSSSQEKSNTCATTPTGKDKNTAPLSQPANIKSVADCKKQCKAKTACKSFTFGNNVCKLFSVAATSVPAPTNGKSVQVFDVGCSV